MNGTSDIQYLTQQQINKEKWDRCIRQADNGLIYSFSWYLDHMTANWDGLVLGDYEAVMALTWKEKFGIRYLYQPFLTAMLATNEPLAWPDDGELDIMEHVGHNPGFVHGTIHCKKYNHVIGTQKTDTIYVPDYADAFHVYSTEWDKDSVRVAMDDSVYFRFANEHSGYDAWPFDNKMYLLLNIAVGGTWGGMKGVDSTIFPKRMEIDYVRVYQKK